MASLFGTSRFDYFRVRRSLSICVPGEGRERTDDEATSLRFQSSISISYVERRRGWRERRRFKFFSLDGLSPRLFPCWLEHEPSVTESNNI
jgi:hypothetical protein